MGETCDCGRMAYHGPTAVGCVTTLQSKLLNPALREYTSVVAGRARRDLAGLRAGP